MDLSQSATTATLEPPAPLTDSPSVPSVAPSGQPPSEVVTSAPDESSAPPVEKPSREQLSAWLDELTPDERKALPAVGLTAKQMHDGWVTEQRKRATEAQQWATYDQQVKALEASPPHFTAWMQADPQNAEAYRNLLEWRKRGSKGYQDVATSMDQVLDGMKAYYGAHPDFQIPPDDFERIAAAANGDPGQWMQHLADTVVSRKLKEADKTLRAEYEAKLNDALAKHGIARPEPVTGNGVRSSSGGSALSPERYANDPAYRQSLTPAQRDEISRMVIAG